MKINRKLYQQIHRFITIAALALLIVLSILFTGPEQIQPVSAQVEEAAITISPAAATIDGCASTEVEIWLHDVENFYGAEIYMSFDPAIVQVVDSNPGQNGVQIEVGDFWTPGWTVENHADNTAGTISYAATQLNPTEAVNGSGVLLKITFQGIAAGSSPLSFTSTKLSNRPGEEIPAPTTDGSLSTTAPASPTLAIAKLNATDLRLSWNAIAETNVQYQLYRDTAPYFTPAAPAFQTTSSTSYDDLGALGNPATNYYYVLRSECETGFQSGNTNRVGEFDFAITPGAVGGTNWSSIAMPLDDTVRLPNAQAIADEITGIQQNLRWNPTRQDFDFWLPPFSFGTNFGTVFGDSYMVLADDTANLVFTTVGDVPPATGNSGALAYNLIGGSPCQFNAIILPLDMGGTITNAQELAASIGNVDQILSWNAVRQDFDFWLPPFNFGINFETKTGYPYMVCTTVARVWP